MTTITSGLGDYKVRLKNQAGVLVAEFDTWLSLYFTHKVNSRGTIRFEINGEDSRSELFVLDGQIEVWRRNPIVDLDWYLEWAGLFRTSNDFIKINDNNNYVAYGFSYLDFAHRGHIMWKSGTAQAFKEMAAETAMKEYVLENIGVLALASAGRRRDHVYPGLTVQASSGAGSTWAGASEDENLMSVLEDIAFFTAYGEAVIDFDIVANGDAQFEFRTYPGQRGTDHTETGGNTPVIFSTTYGNMAVPMLSKNRSSEKTVAFALGRGIESEREVSIEVSAEASDSPWNAIETVANASSTTGADQVSQRVAVAKSELRENQFEEALSFQVLQLPSVYYGKHYTWGDKVTANYKGQKFDRKIAEVRVSVSPNANSEKIDISFSDLQNRVLVSRTIDNDEKEKELDVVANLQDEQRKTKKKNAKQDKKPSAQMEVKDTTGDYASGDSWNGRTVLNLPDGSYKVFNDGAWIAL